MKRTGQNNKRGGGAFRLFALLLTALCAALTAGGLVRVYRLSAAYEHSTPLYVANGVLAWFREENYTAIASAAGLTFTPFEDASCLGELLRESTDGGALRAVRLSHGRYRIESGGALLAELTLSARAGEGRYGLEQWSLDTLSLAGVAPRANLTVVAPAAAAVSINGRALGAEFAEDTLVPVNEFGALPASAPPAVLTRYRVSGLFCAPRVTALSRSGDACPVELSQDEAVVTLPADAQTVALLSPLAEQAATAYAKFISKDAEREDVLVFFLEETQFYKHLKQYDNQWYNDHDAFAFSDMQTGSWQALDDAHARCDITFRYTVTMGRRVFDYPSHYTLYFVDTPSGWKISNLAVR